MPEKFFGFFGKKKEGEQPKPSGEPVRMPSFETTPSKKEQARILLLTWAKKNRLNEDESFRFEDDGGIIALKDLDPRSAPAGSGSLHEEMPHIKEVKGDLWLQQSGITSLRNMPEIVRGRVYLDNNGLTDLQGLPKVIGALSIRDNPLKSLDGLEGVKVGGIVFSNKQRDLADKAREMGYEVDII